MQPTKYRWTTIIALVLGTLALLGLLLGGTAGDVGIEVDKPRLAWMIGPFLAASLLFFIISALLRLRHPVQENSGQINAAVLARLIMPDGGPFPEGIHLFNLLKKHVGFPGRLPLDSSVQTLMISINQLTLQIPWRRLGQNVMQTEKDLLLNILRCGKVGDFTRIMLDCLLVKGDSNLLFFDYPSYRPPNSPQMKTLAMWLVDQGINIEEFLDEPEFTIDRQGSLKWKAAICRSCSEIKPASIVVRCDESMEFACTDRVHLFMAVCRALGLT